MKSIQYYTYVYKDPSRINCKGFPEEIYVGKGTGRRSRVHLIRTDKHPFVQRLQLMKTNNISPIIEIIDALDEQHAYFMEECLIQCIGRKNLGKGTLLNLTDGGDAPPSHLGKKRSKETKLRMSASLQGKPGLKGLLSPHFGKPKSAEVISKMSASSVGRVPWNKGNCRPGSRAPVPGLCKRCTIDGITIYSSKAAMIASLGQGVNGTNNPEFRFL